MPANWETTSVRHGTHSGWKLRQKLGERPCTPCYLAKKNYDKNRKLVPEQQLKNRLTATAQHHALRKLKDAHPEEYRKAYLEAKAQVFKEAGYDDN